MQKASIAAVCTVLPAMLPLLRAIQPIARIFGRYFVTRFDDVREVFATDHVFQATYGEQLPLVIGSAPFVLGLQDGSEYRANLDALHQVILPKDLPRLSADVERRATEIVAEAAGALDLVADLVRPVAFDSIADYLGVSRLPGAQVQAWGMRLFEYVFFKGDDAFRAEVSDRAGRLRDDIAAELDACRKRGDGEDTVLARCLRRQAAGSTIYTDEWIVTALTGLIVGGPPQLAMVLPKALAQLFRRPEALGQARQAAAAGEDERLYRIIYEAMRFDPIAPGFQRTTSVDYVLARGTPREKRIPVGASVLAATRSAMQDPRRINEPKRFDPDRQTLEYLHSGYGLHQCLARHIIAATLPMYLKALLRQKNLRQAGPLKRIGYFPSSLAVRWDQAITGSKASTAMPSVIRA